MDTFGFELIMLMDGQLKPDTPIPRLKVCAGDGMVAVGRNPAIGTEFSRGLRIDSPKVSTSLAPLR